MYFSRKVRVPVAPRPDRIYLHRIERVLKQRGIATKRHENAIEAKLFSWNELLTISDADRFSWTKLRVENQNSRLELKFFYNWPLQAVAHFMLTVFVAAFMNRFGESEALLPMIASMNLALALASFAWAHFYATKLSTELTTTALDSHISDSWLESA